ncbi:MAG: UDP-2,3-diacylglucosamine diphosphatase LpxI [Rickettsiales bacterium]|nr:UDP-2,3-diacylglucosamine diphosphatase LpxI [Rickettsiales bacterium]
MDKVSKDKTDCIAVVAGSGIFPSLLISHLQQIKEDFVVLCLNNNTSSKDVKNTKHVFIELGEIGKALTFLKQHQVTKIVFAGKIQRPSLMSMKLDRKGLSFLAKMGMSILKGGDDKILSSVVKLLEMEGFEIIAPEKVLPNLVTPIGVIGKVKPSKQDYEDIALGRNVLEALGNLDVGQAVVVENKYVLGIEAAEGTDNLILRCEKLRREKNRSGAMIKMKKTSQERRIDLPAIGNNTILNAYKAGLRGIAIEANNSLIVDIDSVIEKANEFGLFLIGV